MIIINQDKSITYIGSLEGKEAIDMMWGKALEGIKLPTDVWQQIPKGKYKSPPPYNQGEFKL